MGAMSSIPRDLSLYRHKHDRRKDGTHEMNGPYAYSTCFGAEVKVVLFRGEKNPAGQWVCLHSAYRIDSHATAIVGVHHCLSPLRQKNE